MRKAAFIAAVLWASPAAALDFKTAAETLLNGYVAAGRFSGAVLVGVALLCVSTLPVWNFKNFKVPTANVLPLLLGVVIFAAILFADPFSAGALLDVAYIIMLPFSLRSYRRLAAQAESRRAAALEA